MVIFRFFFFRFFNGFSMVFQWFFNGEYCIDFKTFKEVFCFFEECFCFFFVSFSFFGGSGK